jgi:hypothetical protein
MHAKRSCCAILGRHEYVCISCIVLNVLQSIVFDCSDCACTTCLYIGRLSIQWTIRHTGPGALTTCLDSIYVSRVPSVVGGDETWDSTHSPLILPKEYFHSIPNTVRVDLKDEGPEAAVRRKQLLDAFCRNEVCIAVHWWQQSWQSNKTT